MKSAFSEFSQETREYSIIGCFLTWSEKLDFIKDLDTWMFTMKTSNIIFDSIKSLYNNSRPVSYAEVSLWLTDQTNDGFKVQYETFIRKAIDSAYPIDSIAINSFVEAAQLRRISTQIDEVQTSVKSGSDDLPTLINKLDKIRASGYKLRGNIKEFIPGSFYEKRIQMMKKRERTKQVFFGLNSLDSLVPGGQVKKEISVIASRAGMAKNTLKTNLIKSQCELGFRIASIATEQTEEVETDRMDSLITKIPVVDFRNSRMWGDGDPRIDKLKRANQYIDERWQYFLNVNRNITTKDVAIYLRDITNKYGELDVVYIDLFDKLKDVNVDSMKASLIGKKLGEMNILAEELNLHICLLVQVNRQVKDVKSHRPEMWHIKDSGAYEEVARLIMLLHRESYYKPNMIDDILEVIIAKQNNGPSGSNVVSKLKFNKEILELTEIETGTPHIF